MFNVVLSKALSLAEWRTIIVRCIGVGARFDLAADGGALAYEADVAWFLVSVTSDAHWPQNLACLNLPESLALGLHVDMEIAEAAATAHGTDALCDVRALPGVGDLDPQDPYWALALIGHKWFLVSTAGTSLMGPYIWGDGTETPGTASVKIIREVKPPSLRLLNSNSGT